MPCQTSSADIVEAIKTMNLIKSAALMMKRSVTGRRRRAGKRDELLQTAKRLEFRRNWIKIRALLGSRLITSS